MAGRRPSHSSLFFGLCRWAWVLVVLVHGLPARSHPLLQNTWWVTIETNRLTMRVSSTLREVSLVCGPAFSEHLPSNLAGWQAGLVQQGAYLRQHLQVSTDSQPLELALVDWTLVADSASNVSPESPDYLDQTRAVFDIEAPWKAGPAPQQFRFSTTTLEEQRYAPGVSWDVIYAIAVKDSGRILGSGIVRSGLPFDVQRTNGVGGVISSSRLPRVEVSEDTRGFGAYLRLGIHHILTGYDHLLFLAALALAAVRGRDFLQLVIVFTVAHSVTVTCSAMNWVRLPSSVVEPVIALSIVLVAVENCWAPRRAASSLRLVTAFSFGLVHGLGFATGLNEAFGHSGGSSLAIAILAFCLGVECGHLMVGVPFWNLIRWMGSHWGESVRTRLQRIGSILIALGGTYFLVAAIRQYY